MPKPSDTVDPALEPDKKKSKVRKQYATLAEARKALVGKHGPMFFDNSEPNLIPTRFWRLGMFLGGGLPQGRIMELWGPPGGWKTTQGLVMMADMQTAFPDKSVLFIDNEQTFPENYARRHGLILKPEDVVRPDYLEQGYDAAVDMMGTGEISAVMVDSAVSIATWDEVNAVSLTKDLIADRARKLTQFLYAAVGLARKHGTTLIMVNQMREKIGGNTYGSNEHRPGGKTFEHLASVILRCSNTQDGAKTSIVKNKVTGRRREFMYAVTEGEGIDLSCEFLDYLVMLGVVKQAGAYYKFGKTNKQGRAAAAAFANEKQEALLPLAAEECKKLRDAWRVDVETDPPEDTEDTECESK